MNDPVRERLTEIILTVVHDYNSLANAEDIAPEIDEIMTTFHITLKEQQP